MSLITLTTDFGAQDWFVGAMKGIILSLNPHAMVVDITHEVPSRNVRAAAFTLAASYACFPPDTVHVAVVDPGVGSSRAAIAVKTARYLFIGPDNGVLSLALAQEQVEAVHRLENPRFFLPHVSSTFHGRDVFAPVAAHLADGLSLEHLGPRLDQFIRLPWPQPITAANVVRGEIVYIDRFGNGITNINRAHLATLESEKLVITVRRRRLKLRRFYQEVRSGWPLALIGSTGFLEIAVHGNSAAKRLRLWIGLFVEARPVPARRAALPSAAAQPVPLAQTD